LLYLWIVALTGCTIQTKVVRPDWQNPDHLRVGSQVVSLLRSVDRDPRQCKVSFVETEKLNAVSLGNCTFGFTTGLISTGDERLIRGVAAHEVAHEVLGHAGKRKAAAASEQAIRTALSFIPSVRGLVATSAVLVAGMLALPAYSRSQEAEADEKAVEILQAVGETPTQRER
jgi:Zn-dependent protease with chaperone function